MADTPRDPRELKKEFDALLRQAEELAKKQADVGKRRYLATFKAMKKGLTDDISVNIEAIQGFIDSADNSLQSLSSTFEDVFKGLQATLAELSLGSSKVNLVTKAMKGLSSSVEKLYYDESSLDRLTSGQLKKELTRIKINQRRFEDNADDAKREIDSIIKKTNLLGASVEIYDKEEDAISRINKAQQGLTGIAKKYSSIRSRSNKLAGTEIKNLAVEYGLVTEQQAKALSTEKVYEKIKSILSLTDKQKEMYQILQAQERGEFDYYKTTIHLIQDRIEEESRYNSALGLTGALLDNLQNIGLRAFGGIGINLGVLNDYVDIAREKIKGMADDIAKANRPITFMDRFRIMTAAAGPVIKGLASALTDPLITLTAIAQTLYKAFTEVNQATIELQRYTGASAANILEANDTVGVLSKNFGKVVRGTVEGVKQGRSFTQAFRDTRKTLTGINTDFATLQQQLEITLESSKQLGISTNVIFGSDELARAAELANRIGMSAEEASGLLLQSKLTGTSITDNSDNLKKQLNTLNRTNKTAVNYKEVLTDVSTVSLDISLSLGSSTERLANAAYQARRLGLNLSQVDQIAGSILDFESSIEAELTAQLTTGQQLNLSRARELALLNDYEGLTKEIGKNVISIQEFSNLTRIGQEDLAKALGVSRSELARMVALNALNQGLSSKQVELMTGLTEEQQKQVTFQEQFNILTQKLAQSFLPFVEVLNSALDILTAFPSIVKGLTYLILGKLALTAVRVLASKFIAVKNVIGGLGSGISKFFSIMNGNMKVTEKLKNAFTGIVGSMKKMVGLSGKTKPIEPAFRGARVGRGARGRFVPLETTQDKTKRVSRKAEEVQRTRVDQKKPTRGAALRDLAGGLRALGGRGTLKGVGVLMAAAPALLLAAPGMALFGAVARFGAVVGTSLAALAGGLSALGAISRVGFVGAGLLGAAGLAMLTAAPGLGLLGLVSPLLPFIGAGLGALAGGLAALGAVGPAAGIGIAVIGGLGLALWTFTPIVKSLVPIVEILGQTIVSVLGSIPPILDSLTKGFQGFLGAIKDTSVKSMIGFAGGLVAIGAAGVSAAPGLLMLAGVGTALTYLVGHLKETTPLFETLKGTILGTLQGISGVVQTTSDSINRLVETLPLLQKASQAVSNLGNIGVNLTGFNELKSVLSSTNIVVFELVDSLGRIGDLIYLNLVAKVKSFSESLSLVIQSVKSFSFFVPQIANNFKSTGNSLTKSIDELQSLGPKLGETAFALRQISNNITSLSYIEKLSGIAPGISQTALALLQVAEGIKEINKQITTLDDQKIKGIELTQSVVRAETAPATLPKGNTTSGPVNLLKQSSEASSNTSETSLKIVAKLDELISIVRRGGTINLDGNKVGEGLIFGNFQGA